MDAASTAALFTALEFFLALASNSAFYLSLSESLAIPASPFALDSAHVLDLSTNSASAFSLASLAFLIFYDFSLISASTLALDLAYALSIFSLLASALTLILAAASAAAL